MCAGVSSLISLVQSAREQDQPRLNVLLCEAVVAVYLSLLIHGLGTHSGNELFRLAAHPLNNRMWAAVFGGGAKVIIKPKRPEIAPGRPRPLSPTLPTLPSLFWVSPSLFSGCSPGALDSPGATLSSSLYLLRTLPLLLPLTHSGVSGCALCGD